MARADEVVLDGEGQHVGRPLPAEEPLVELGDGRLVDEHHRQLGPVPDATVGEDPLGEGDPAAEVDRPVGLLVGTEDLGAHRSPAPMVRAEVERS